MVLIRIPATGSGESAPSCRSTPSNWGSPLGWLGAETPARLKKPAEPPQSTALGPYFSQKVALLEQFVPEGFLESTEREELLTQGISLFSPGSHPLKKMPGFNRLFPLASLLLILWGKYQHPAMRDADDSNNANSNNTY